MLDDKNNKLRTATCKFTGVSIVISEGKGEAVISLYAKLDEVNINNYFTVTLQSVVSEFNQGSPLTPIDKFTSKTNLPPIV